ncbi:UNVERIFIED_CONTAM: 2-carboxy-1,4-naphthoquinone phytyltransferase, chloroplastic [Sesamum latifolium]|uniref:2-carboxy-1,4-naphthoquinone phytyltransferase, chloroplastic n=1 Tax=Sesamum latifolium TaxID=2727402 RepID=A0AAW2UZC5_9LAMI
MEWASPYSFISFGPFSAIPFYLLHSITRELPLSSTVIWASVLVGLATSLILFCSHFRQIEDDKAVRKMSPLVRLKKGSLVVKWYIIGLYSLLLALGFTQTLPFPTFDKRKLFFGKYYCVRLHAIFGVALAAGFVVARMFTKQPLPQAIGL